MAHSCQGSHSQVEEDGLNVRLQALLLVRALSWAVRACRSRLAGKRWTEEGNEAISRLIKGPVSFWEETSRRHGPKPDAGYLLGGKVPDVADIVTATRWSTMIYRLPPLGKTLERVALMTAASSRRIASIPALAALADKARADYDNAYEASLRKVLRV